MTPGKQKVSCDELKRQRWFQQKDAVVREITPLDSIPLADPYGLGIYEVSFEDQPPDLYVIPTKRGGFKLEVIAEGAFLDTLFTAIDNEGARSTAKGNALFRKFGDWRIDARSSSFGLLEVGSTNTLITCSEKEPRFILKLLRRILEGENVEAEVNRFLAKTNFRNCPAIKADVSYKNESGHIYHIATMFDYVKNDGSGWDWTLGKLTEGIDRFLSESIPPTEQSVGLEMADYNEMMYRLGKVLAGLHSALSGGEPGSGFEMLHISFEDAKRWKEELKAQASRTFASLKHSRARVEAIIPALASEKAVSAIFDQAPSILASLKHKIRQHADFHLGQIIVAGGTFHILDFEGEPLKPYNQRSSHYAALKDVAGMCRSFNYASFNAYLNYRQTNEVTDADTLGRIQKICNNWEGMARRSFLDGYYQELKAQKAAFLPLDDRELLKRALAIHELEKALYEAEYEVNNRPDWLPIPLGGIMNCLGRLA
ncbi:MAG: phosphotransferase [Pseudomonadota bacterium]